MQINERSTFDSILCESSYNRTLAVSILLALLTTVTCVPFASAAKIDWPTYGFNLQRTGENPSENIITPSTAAGLHKIWDFDLGAIAIAQPVLAAGVTVNGTPKDLVFVGDEHGDFYAVDA